MRFDSDFTKIPAPKNNDHQILIEPQCLLFRWEIHMKCVFILLCSLQLWTFRRMDINNLPPFPCDHQIFTVTAHQVGDGDQLNFLRALATSLFPNGSLRPHEDLFRGLGPLFYAWILCTPFNILKLYGSQLYVSLMLKTKQWLCVLEVVI